jgi:hypothetical protein
MLFEWRHFSRISAAFPESSFYGKMSADFRYTLFVLFPKIFRKLHCNLGPASSHNRHPTNCIRTHQNALSLEGNRLYAQPSFPNAKIIKLSFGKLSSGTWNKATVDNAVKTFERHET